MAEVKVDLPPMVTRWRIKWSNGTESRPYGARQYAEYDARVEPTRDPSLRGHTGEIIEFQAPSPPRRMRTCAGCGENLTENRWCSTSCFIAEDGEPWDRDDDLDED